MWSPKKGGSNTRGFWHERCALTEFGAQVLLRRIPQGKIPVWLDSALNAWLPDVEAAWPLMRVFGTSHHGRRNPAHFFCFFRFGDFVLEGMRI
jgi:hypothetical protein